MPDGGLRPSYSLVPKRVVPVADNQGAVDCRMVCRWTIDALPWPIVRDKDTRRRCR